MKRYSIAVMVCMACGAIAATPGIPASVPGQSPQPVQSNDLSVADLRTKLQAILDEARQDLATFAAAHAAASNLHAGAAEVQVVEHRALLEWLVRTYQNHLGDLRKYETVQERLSDITQKSASWSGFADPPPYSVLFVDGLRDNVRAADVQCAAATTTRDMAASMLDDIKTSLDTSETKVRLFNEQIESAKEPKIQARLTLQRDAERTRSRLYVANMAYYETKRRMAEADFLEQQQRLAFVKRQLAAAAAQVGFPRTDLDKILAAADTEQRGIEDEVASAQRDYSATESTLTNVRVKLQQALANQVHASSGATARVDETRALQNLVDVGGIEIETYSQSIEVLRELLDGLEYTRTFWKFRFSMAETTDPAKMQETQQRLDKYLTRMQLAREYYQKQLGLAISLATEQSEHIQLQDPSSTDAGIMRAKLAAYQKREGMYQRALRSTENRERCALNWKDSFSLKQGHMPATARMDACYRNAGLLAVKAWNFELFHAEDTMFVDGQLIRTPRPVSIGKIIMAFGIFVVGYWITSFLSRIFKRVLVRRFRMEPAIANIIRGWSRFMAVLALAVVTLMYVKIPMTIFAFLGGALAIGLGFGMQNLLKNFISGIIILVERPLRVGDVIEVGTTRGQVANIGIRSSVIRTIDGIETLIPNSSFIENDVTNWTYSNRDVRFSIRVGVVYGSNTRRVADILAAVAVAHGQVKRDPAPRVFFEDFGDSALVFSLNYWLEVSAKTDTRTIASDLRHSIEQALREASVVIAYPQRDVHLDATQPLRVEMVQQKKG